MRSIAPVTTLAGRAGVAGRVARGLSAGTDARPLGGQRLGRWAGALRMPESASAQLKSTVTSPLYQPAALGALLAAALTLGAVLSTLTVALALPWLPARSAQLALRLCWPSPLLVLEGGAVGRVDAAAARLVSPVPADGHVVDVPAGAVSRRRLGGGWPRCGGIW